MTDKTIPARGERFPISLLIQIFMPLFLFLCASVSKIFFWPRLKPEPPEETTASGFAKVTETNSHPLIQFDKMKGFL